MAARAAGDHRRLSRWPWSRAGCFDFAALDVQVIGAVDTSIPSPVPPELSLAEVGQLVTAALGLALLIFPEGILLGRAMAEPPRL